MATRLLQLLCSALLVSAIGCSPALAGTINIINGEMTFIGFGSGGSVNLVGDRGFTFKAGVTSTDAGADFLECVIPCPPGTPISPGLLIVGNSFLGARATLDGVPLPNPSCTQPDCFSLSMGFDGNPVIAPPLNVASVVALTNPVTFGGGFLHSNFPLFGSESLVASAEATIVLEKAAFAIPDTPSRNCPLPGSCWTFVSATYELSPVPEPTTLLLWGATVAGTGLLARRRKLKAPSIYHIHARLI